MTASPARTDGLESFSRGDFSAARQRLEAGLNDLSPADRLLAYERLAVCCFLLEDYEAGLEYAHDAYRLHRAASNRRRGASMAIMLANVHSALGNDVVARGWLARARRLLESEGPCPELGYLAVALSACDVPDVRELERQTAVALDLARRFSDPELEVRALAGSGLALVALGRLDAGFERLDEAMAAVVAGEVHNYVIAGTTCCAMLHACDRVDDVERAAEWTRAVTDYARTRFGDPPPPVLIGHCRIALGALLAETGRWPEAEAELRRAIDTTRVAPKRAEASARLAELCVRQGRLAEARRLLSGFEDSLKAALAVARLQLGLDELELAEGTLRSALRRLEGDLPQRVRFLALRVEVLIRRGNAGPAARVAADAVQTAEQLGAPGLLALACLAAGRAADAAGRDPSAELSRALRALGETERPLLRAEILLEMATALRDADPVAAIGEAEAALVIFKRLGTVRYADRALALLRELGVAHRAPPAEVLDPNALSRRERDVLELLGQGLTNAEIGQRLFISSRTAEHHVASILSKLGLRRRSEAAVYAAALPTRR